MLAERAEFIGTATNNVAEYRGLIAGLTAAREIDPDGHGGGRLDSKLVVEQMSGRWKVKHPSMRPLALRGPRGPAARPRDLQWVPRERNKHADRLANEALDAAARGERWSASDEHRGAGQPGATRPRSSPPPAAGARWSAGTPTWAPRRRCCCCGTARRRTRPRSGSAGRAAQDPALTPEGERAGARGGRAAGLGGRGGRVVSSPMRRARQTADVAAAALGLDVREDDGVRECAFGEWEGLTFAEVRERGPTS